MRLFIQKRKTLLIISIHSFREYKPAGAAGQKSIVASPITQFLQNKVRPPN